MKGRIKKIRKELDLTQQEFANRLGIKRGAVANYELGRNEPIDAVISLICREFDVREEWLRTGNGEMFKPRSSDILDQLAYKYKLFNFDYVMIEKFLTMPPDLRRAIYDHFHDIDAALDEMDPYAPAYTGTEPPHPMDKTMESINSRQAGDTVPEKTVEELEAEYKKSRSNSAENKGSAASNTTSDTRKLSNE